MIHPVGWTSAQSLATLKALWSIATLNGTVEPSPAENELIQGVWVNIMRNPEIEMAEVKASIRPPQLAAAIHDQEHRFRAAQLISLMPYAERPYSENQLILAERFIEALGENLHRMEEFIGARQKHSRTMEYDALRKLGRDVFPFEDPEGKHKEILKLLKDAEGDAEELERYQALEGYPKGSLGRGFWDFYAQFDWPLPGDPLWISEELTVRHDLIHVLCEFDISINGEFCVSAFTAGNSETFNWMIAMLGFTPPYVSTGEGFHPDDFFEAYSRGVSASRSFVDNWDFWPFMEHQIGDLRRNYGLL